MMPKSFKQTFKYNDLLVPKEHRETAQRLSFELWNQLMRINSTYPRAQIHVEHFLRTRDDGYTIDMKLRCSNPEVQEMLDRAYRMYMKLPVFDIPESLNKKDIFQ